MDDVWDVTPARAAGMHVVTLRVGPPRPLVARLSDAELARLGDVLPAIAAMVRRGEFSRIQLGAAFREAIGRDPFRQVDAPSRRPGLWPWWGDLAIAVTALSFAADDHAWWWRVAAFALASVALADLIGHLVRQFRPRPAGTGRR